VDEPFPEIRRRAGEASPLNRQEAQPERPTPTHHLAPPLRKLLAVNLGSSVVESFSEGDTPRYAETTAGLGR
jgi:hypothetical protein